MKLLDDLKYIHSKDSKDAFGFALKQPSQLLVDFSLGQLNGRVDHVVFAGAGRSTLWAEIAQIWPKCKVPFEIWRDYSGPAYLGRNSLVIINSYSGDTEEPLSAMKEAETARAQIIVVSNGGPMMDRASEKGHPFIKLPDTLQPRLSTLSGLKTLVAILDRAGLAKENIPETLNKTEQFLSSEMSNWTPQIPTKNNPAKQLALEIAGTTPIIYAGRHLYPAAYKWKIAFNEVAKNLAWSGKIPESSHSEFSGWTSHPVDKPFSIIDLRGSFDHPQVSKRFDLSSKLLSGKRPHSQTVTAKGGGELNQLLYMTMLGEYVALYTAMLNGVDPSELSYVPKLKQGLLDD